MFRSIVFPFLKKWLVLFYVVLITVAGLGAAVAGFLMAFIQNLPQLDVLDNYSPPEISRFYDRTGSRNIGEYFSERREVVQYKDVPEHLINAFLAIEDERFHQHYGVDIEAIGRILFQMFFGSGRQQGGSTITMQVARNVVLRDRSRTIFRKAREMLIALQIERYYSKEQILEFYMNESFLGSRSYGVQAASRRYFSKDVRDLTVPEAALIAGLPKAPSSLSPLINPDRAKARRDLVLAKMFELKYIKTREELERYQASPVVTSAAPVSRTLHPYFTTFSANTVMRDNGMRTTSELGEKGFSVITTLDTKLQGILEEELRRHLVLVERKIEAQKGGRQGMIRPGQPNRMARIRSRAPDHIMVTYNGMTARVPLPEKLPYFEPDRVLRPGNLIDVRIIDIRRGKLEAALYDSTHVQGAAVLLDVRTGEILAMAGGADYNDTGNNGQWNRAVQGGRQPGSSWKPLLYASALDQKDSRGRAMFTPSTPLDDSPITIGGWSPKNYEGKFSGPTSLHECLVRSRNVPTVNLFMALQRIHGRDGLLNLYRRFNLAEGPTGWKLSSDPPMSLGTPNTTPLSLASAYAVFANGGVGVTPTAIKRVSSSKTGETRVVRPPANQVISPLAAFQITRALQDAVSRGTAAATVGAWRRNAMGRGLKVPEVAGKTGTTNDCFVAWFVGYTPDLVLAVYVGFDQHRSMGPKMVGGGTCGPIWSSIMDRVLATRSDWRQKFELTGGLEFRDICSVTGLIATDACKSAGGSIVQNAAFQPGTAPNQNCYHTSQGSPNVEDQLESEPMNEINWN
jgi:penicillin-binding protein 1A